MRLWNVFVKGRLVGVVEGCTVFAASEAATAAYGSEFRLTARI
jgi:hypothetical protein